MAPTTRSQLAEAKKSAAVASRSSRKRPPSVTGQRVPNVVNLTAVVQKDDFESVGRILAAAGEAVHCVNSDEQSLLFFAVQREDQAAQVCRLLLDGYKVPVDHIDARGQTALHWLATTHNSDCVDILADHGCNPNHVDDLLKQTPIFYAAHRGSAELTRRLLDRGANPLQEDVRGRTPFSWAGSIATCRELAVEYSMSTCKAEAKAALGQALRCQRMGQRHDLAAYVHACKDGAELRGCMSWIVADDGGSFSAYATALSAKGDVPQLCLLENEFIQDHRELLVPDVAANEEELFDMIGLTEDATVRHSLVSSIAGAVGRVQRGDVRHYTLACHALPGHSIVSEDAPLKDKVRRSVGYVYFRVCDGQPEDRYEPGDPIITEPGGGVDVGYMIISHLKVSKADQRRGVGTLLLAGALRTAMRKSKGGNFRCTNIYLSVVEKNIQARRLYEKLGFVLSTRPCAHKGWVAMRRRIDEPSLEVLADNWLRSVWSSQHKVSSTPSSTPSSTGTVMRMSPTGTVMTMSSTIMTISLTGTVMAMSSTGTVMTNAEPQMMSDMVSSSPETLDMDAGADTDDTEVSTPPAKRLRRLRAANSNCESSDVSTSAGSGSGSVVSFCSSAEESPGASSLESSPLISLPAPSGVATLEPFPGHQWRVLVPHGAYAFGDPIVPLRILSSTSSKDATVDVGGIILNAELVRNNDLSKFMKRGR